MTTKNGLNSLDSGSQELLAGSSGRRSLIERAATGLHYLGGIVLATMMFLTAFDVIGRFVFNAPIKGSQELSEVMLVLTVFFGVAYTALKKEHVRVELLLMYLNRKTQLLLKLFASIVSCVLVFGIMLEGIELMVVQRQRFITTMLLEIPQWPFALLLAAGALLLCLVLLKEIGHDFRSLKADSWPARQWLLVAIVAVALTGLVVWGVAVKESVDPATVGIVGMALMLIIMFMGVPIGFCMSLAGTLGMMYLIEPATGLTLLRTTPFDTTCNYSLTVVPLFILMGAITFHSGIGKDLYMLAYRWLGHLPGGLSIATIGACGGFAAVSGSSLATAATMGMVALPEMKHYKYDNALATGCLAAGGTLGILIPPSVVLIIYGFLTTTSIATLFMAGFVPGVVQVILYMITVYVICKIKPEMGPRGSRSTMREKMLSLKDTWGVIFLFVLVIGGLYVGVFTPTEAGGVGAFGAFVFIILRGRFNFTTMSASLKDSVKTTAMSFMVLMGAMFLGYFLTATQLPSLLSDVVSSLPYNRYVVLVMILVVYILLGCVMDSLSIVLITVPIFFPVVEALGFDPIWFGIIMVRVVEIGMITPPVGINVFIIQGVAGDVPMHTIFKGVMPFLAADFVHVALLIVLPDMALYLPRILGM